MALVPAKKCSALLPSSSEEEDDLIRRSSKKIKNGQSSGATEEWPELGKVIIKQWSKGQSFAEKLQGINGGGQGDENSNGGKVLSDDTMSHSESEGDDSEPLCTIREDPHRNIPTFTFSEKMKKRLYKAWHQAVIVKLLGRAIGYKLLLSISQAMWAKKGVISLINVGNGFFVVKFTNREDFSNALTGGPWMVFDHYLTVRPWEPQFQPWRASIEKVDGGTDHTAVIGDVEEPRVSSQVRLTREKKGGLKKKQAKQKIVEGGSTSIAGEESAEDTTMVVAEVDMNGLSSSNAEGDQLGSVSSYTMIFSSIPYDSGDLNMNLSSGPSGKFWASSGKEGMECKLSEGDLLENDNQVD
ncbi:hypothetical protein K1719_023578 [Acacia pycnantha]|nr:hypothetical protein K1719_023578 [Acacia pycnantha]